MTEPVVIVLQTWQRTDCAVRTIRAALRNLVYPDLRWYVADDGSRQEHFDVILSELAGTNLIGWHSERRGYGGNINAAIQAAHDVAALVLPLEDDWELSAPIDLYPYAALLMEREDIAMVRLGYLNPGIRGECVSHGGALYWKLDHEPAEHWQLAFTGHPSLRHRRYRQAYGDYPTGLGPGDTELAYAYQYRVGSGPSIVWPAAYPPNGLFGHIGIQKTETML